MHSLEYVVLTRDKGVPTFIRKLAREALLAHGLTSEQIEGIKKS